MSIAYKGFVGLVDELQRALRVTIPGDPMITDLEADLRAMWKPIETAPKARGDEEDDHYVWVLVYQPKGFHPVAPRKGQHAWRDLPPSKTDEAGRVIEWPHHEEIRSAYFDPYSERWWTGEAFDSDCLYPTHWMPIPLPPKETA